MDKIDLHAFYLSGIYCHKTGILPPSCQSPRQPTIYVTDELLDGATSVPMSILGLVFNDKLVTYVLYTACKWTNESVLFLLSIAYHWEVRVRMWKL